MSKKTPLEETFNLPSVDELNKQFSSEEIESHNEESETDEEMGEYLAELSDGNWDADEIENPEELKKQIQETKQKIQDIEEQERQYKHLKKYHTDVDKIHTTAMDKFDEIMTVALTMEAGAGSKYLASATKLLDIALNAKNSGMDREIEMAKLQLRKEKQDHDMNKPKTKNLGTGGYVQEEEEDEDDESELYDRNAILRNMGNKED